MLGKQFATAALAALIVVGASADAFAQEKKKGLSRPASPAVAAMRERQRKCGAEWREAKAAGKVEKGMKWSKYWSACNKRLKGAAS